MMSELNNIEIIYPEIDQKDINELSITDQDKDNLHKTLNILREKKVLKYCNNGKTCRNIHCTFLHYPDNNDDKSLINFIISVYTKYRNIFINEVINKSEFSNKFRKHCNYKSQCLKIECPFIHNGEEQLAFRQNIQIQISEDDIIKRYIYVYSNLDVQNMFRSKCKYGNSCNNYICCPFTHNENENILIRRNVMINIGVLSNLVNIDRIKFVIENLHQTSYFVRPCNPMLCIGNECKFIHSYKECSIRNIVRQMLHNIPQDMLSNSNYKYNINSNGQYNMRSIYGKP